MKQSNPQRVAYFRQRLESLTRLYSANRFKPGESKDRLREMDALQWAIPILERHAKEAFESQQTIERENAAKRADDPKGA